MTADENEGCSPKQYFWENDKKKTLLKRKASLYYIGKP